MISVYLPNAPFTWVKTEPSFTQDIRAMLACPEMPNYSGIMCRLGAWCNWWQSWIMVGLHMHCYPWWSLLQHLARTQSQWHLETMWGSKRETQTLTICRKFCTPPKEPGQNFHPPTPLITHPSHHPFLPSPILSDSLANFRIFFIYWVQLDSVTKELIFFCHFLVGRGSRQHLEWDPSHPVIACALLVMSISMTGGAKHRPAKVSKQLE